MNAWVIKPATTKETCSLVELMCEPGTTKQTPLWFVSHCWCVPCTQSCAFLSELYANRNEAVLDFILAVEEHAKVRALSEADAWWVCAYGTPCLGQPPAVAHPISNCTGNNQHELAKVPPSLPVPCYPTMPLLSLAPFLSPQTP